MSLTITTSVEGSEHRVNVAGEVDVSCADELRQAIDAQLADAKGGELVVDLSEVPISTPRASAFSLVPPIAPPRRPANSSLRTRSATSHASWAFSAYRPTSTSARPSSLARQDNETGDLFPCLASERQSSSSSCSLRS